MKTYSKVVVYLIACEFLDIVFSHHLLRHRVQLEKKEEIEKEHPFILRPYSISKEFWLPFGSFGFKKHVVVKRQAEEIRPVEEKSGDLDSISRLPVPGIGGLSTGPIHADPLPPDTPLIRPIDAPPMIVPVSEVPAPVLPAPVVVSPPKTGLNTDISPFIPPVKQVEENLVLPVEPPKIEPPEDFGNYMRRGSQLVLDFGRYVFERMSKLFERARATFIRPPAAR